MLRLPRVYGPHDPLRREEPLLRRVRAGRRAVPVGAGTWLWTKGYVDDMASAVLATLDRADVATGQVFNVCEPTTVSYRRWCEQVLAAAGAPDVELVVVPESLVPDDLRLTAARRHHLLLSASKAERVLGWRHSDVERAIRASVTWHLANPPSDDGDFAADDEALAAVPR